jgi:hypothetical protein
MKFQKAFLIPALASAATVLTAAAIADTYDVYTEGGYIPAARSSDRVVIIHDQGRKARSLSEVGAIRIRGGVCEADIAQHLTDHGFVVANSGSANAVLDVDMNTNGSLSRPHSVEEGTYQATLLGANDRILFSTAGHEGAHNLASLCDDVGEDIADRLEDRVG